MGEQTSDDFEAVRAEVERAMELRQRVLALAVRALEASSAARRTGESSAQGRAASRAAREQSAALRKRSLELRGEVAELRTTATNYAAMLRQLGESSARAIEDAMTIADEAARTVAHSRSIERPERDDLSRNLVLWAIDGYVTV